MSWQELRAPGSRSSGAAPQLPLPAVRGAGIAVTRTFFFCLFKFSVFVKMEMSLGGVKSHFMWGMRMRVLFEERKCMLGNYNTALQMFADCFFFFFLRE